MLRQGPGQIQEDMMRSFCATALALAFAGLAGGCGDTGELSQYEPEDTMMETCSESVFGFPPDSAILSDAAEQALFEAVDRIGTECEGASIEIVAFADQAGDQMAYARTASVENAIVSSYGISDSRISKETREAPSLDLADHVRVVVSVEVPVIEE